MPTISIATTVSAGGVTISGTATRTGEGVICQDPTLAAGIEGTLTTRTDNDTGVVTLLAGHGITDTDTVDIYWPTGIRYGMVVTAYDSTTISINLGAGDNLPDDESAVVVGVRTEINMDVDGDDLEFIIAMCERRSSIVFLDSGPAVLAAIELTANEPWSWVSGQGVTNPLTGNAIDTIQVSCGEADSGQLKIISCYDSVS